MAIVKIPAKTSYQTADGKTFFSFSEAQRHDAYLERRTVLENTLKKANGAGYQDNGAFNRLLVAIQTNPAYGKEVLKNIQGLMSFVQRRAAKKA